MSGRLNFVCACDRLLEPKEYLEAFNGIFAALGDFVVEPAEVLRINEYGTNSDSLPWEEASPLVSDALKPDELLFCYFVLAGTEAAERHSVAIEVRLNLSVVSLSFSPKLLSPAN